MEPVAIEFFKPERRRYDLAHFVVEDGLGLEAGLWGVLAAGGMFGHAKVIAGRRPPHFAGEALNVTWRLHG